MTNHKISVTIKQDEYEALRDIAINCSKKPESIAKYAVLSLIKKYRPKYSDVLRSKKSITVNLDDLDNYLDIH